MSGRQSNKLPNNLPQLQNLIKRDPQSYVEEVRARFLYVCVCSWTATDVTIPLLSIPCLSSFYSSTDTTSPMCRSSNCSPTSPTRSWQNWSCFWLRSVCLWWAGQQCEHSLVCNENSSCASGWSLLHAAAVWFPSGAVWAADELSHSPGARAANGENIWQLQQSDVHLHRWLEMFFLWASPCFPDRPSAKHWFFWGTRIWSTPPASWSSSLSCCDVTTSCSGRCGSSVCKWGAVKKHLTPRMDFFCFCFFFFVSHVFRSNKF